MSVAKITRVEKSRKDQGECGRCHTPLPKGTGYLYWLPYFRSNYKAVRCLNEKCFPPPSERESSKVSTIMAAQEAFDASIDELDTRDDIIAAVQEVADAIEEVRGEYDDALSSWEYGNEALQEKVDHYESQHSELDGWEPDAEEYPEQCDEHDELDSETEVVTNCEECKQLRQDWLEEMRGEARDKVGEVEFL